MFDVNGNVDNPRSLLNHDNWIDDEAIEFTLPVDPMYENPCASDERRRSVVKVDDAVESSPLTPSTDVVELPHDCEVNGNT